MSLEKIFLMNPPTGTVDTLTNWHREFLSSQASGTLEEDGWQLTWEESLRTLTEVTQDANGNWIEA